MVPFMADSKIYSFSLWEFSSVMPSAVLKTFALCLPSGCEKLRQYCSNFPAGITAFCPWGKFISSFQTKYFIYSVYARIFTFMWHVQISGNCELYKLSASHGSLSAAEWIPNAEYLNVEFRSINSFGVRCSCIQYSAVHSPFPMDRSAAVNLPCFLQR